MESVFGLGRVELLHPTLRRDDDFFRAARAQLDAGAVARAVGVMLEVVEQRGNGWPSMAPEALDTHQSAPGPQSGGSCSAWMTGQCATRREVRTRERRKGRTCVPRPEYTVHQNVHQGGKVGLG